MNLEAVIRELRATKLPTLRQRQLTVEAAHCPSDDARALLVARARHEATQADRAHQEAGRAEFAARWQHARERDGWEPEPVTPKAPPVPDRPEVRPVRISWTTPKRPDIIRPERHLEIHKGQERSRTQRELAEVAEQTQTVNRPAPMWDDDESAPVPKPVPVIEHGMRGYKAGCRCDECRQAKRESRARKIDRAPRGSIPQHGTLTG